MVPEAAAQSQPQFESLPDRFCDMLANAGGEVVRVGSLASAHVALSGILESLALTHAVANGVPELADLRQRFPSATWTIAGEVDRETLREASVSAEIGISGSLAAIAETGSVLLACGAGRSHLPTLLPPIHVAYVATSIITSDLVTFAATYEDAPPANLAMVSGPSKAADMGQTLAKGVHAPKRFIAIVYDE